jgi:hypothetical protein
MRTVLLAEPRCGASYVLECLKEVYNDVHLVTEITKDLDYYEWLLEDSRVIVLHRLNRSRQIISYCIARQFKQHLTEEYSNRLIEVLPRVNIEQQDLDQLFKITQDLSKLVSLARPAEIDFVVYENLLLNGQLHPYKIKEQLGIAVTKKPLYIRTPYTRAPELYIKNYKDYELLLTSIMS